MLDGFAGIGGWKDGMTGGGHIHDVDTRDTDCFSV